jgi:hypothetical protein
VKSQAKLQYKQLWTTPQVKQLPITDELLELIARSHRFTPEQIRNLARVHPISKDLMAKLEGEADEHMPRP